MPATEPLPYVPPAWAERHWREFTHGIDAAASSLFPLDPLKAPPPRSGSLPLALRSLDPNGRDWDDAAPRRRADGSVERASRIIGWCALAVGFALFAYMATRIGLAWHAGRIG